ncbi:MAG: 50S ribosomal protein L28 [Patescibacteria group bacterium]
MSKRCDLCGRGSQKGAQRSHSNIKTLRRQNINLQSKKINGRRLLMCGKCLKTLKNKI